MRKGKEGRYREERIYMVCTCPAIQFPAYILILHGASSENSSQTTNSIFSHFPPGIC